MADKVITVIINGVVHDRYTPAWVKGYRPVSTTKIRINQNDKFPRG